MDDQDQTLAQAAQDAFAPVNETAAERIRAAAKRDEAAAEVSDQTDGAALSPDVPQDPDTASPGVADEESGDPATPTPEPPPDGLVNCPVCNGEGRVPEQLRHAPDTDTCPDCGGLGVVGTGSLLSEYAVIACRKCMGNGYVDKPQSFEPAAVTPDLGPNAWEVPGTPRY